ERERSDVWNAETVTRLGELIGVAVLIHGRVTKYGVQETVQDQILGTNEGEPIFMRTRTAVAEIVCSITAADTSTGRVLDSANLTARAEDSATNLNGDPAPIDHSDLLRQVREKIVNQYITRVLPYEEWVAVRLYIDSDFPQLEVGNRLLQTGAWDEAISQYREALDRMTGELGKARWKALYNLGIALTYAGKFADARDALREAHAVSASSEALEALSIVDQREREYKALYPTSESNDAV
ncbi:MAG TPA: DUF6340 family protein, partial [Planctomycetota bacterium]|nr:DUF6340 family protein [Planctomycetota bacterium]